MNECQQSKSGQGGLWAGLTFPTGWSTILLIALASILSGLIGRSLALHYGGGNDNQHREKQEEERRSKQMRPGPPVEREEQGGNTAEEGHHQNPSGLELTCQTADFGWVVLVVPSKLFDSLHYSAPEEHKSTGQELPKPVQAQSQFGRNVFKCDWRLIQSLLCLGKQLGSDSSQFRRCIRAESLHLVKAMHQIGSPLQPAQLEGGSIALVEGEEENSQESKRHQSGHFSPGQFLHVFQQFSRDIAHNWGLSW